MFIQTGMYSGSITRSSRSLIEESSAMRCARGCFCCESCEDLSPMIIGCDTSWKAMLGKDERDATDEEVAALESAHGPLLPADGEG